MRLLNYDNESSAGGNCGISCTLTGGGLEEATRRRSGQDLANGMERECGEYSG